MRTFIIFILLFTPVITFGQCEKAATSYGNGEGADSIPAECRSLAVKFAGKSAKKFYGKAKVDIVGYKNILFVNDQVFAGEFTLLKEIVAVAYDEKTAEAAALESSGDVLIFNAKIPGNVAPVRVIRHQDLDGASDVSFLKDEIAVHIGQRKEVLTFSRLANFYGREGKKNLSIRRQILNATKLPE